MRMNGNNWVYTIIILAMLFVIVWSVIGMDFFESRLLPIVMGSIVLLLALIGVGREIRTLRKTGEKNNKPGSDKTGVRWSSYFINLLWVGALILGIYLLGFFIAIFL